jgi:glycosyltransferase involved in cell wall biosynthesis
MRAEPRLTVMQLLPALKTGGVERGTLEVAAALVRAGHRSLVVAEAGRLVAELVAGGSEHIDWPIGRKSPRVLRWLPRLRELLVRERVDILHVRSRLPAWLAWLAWRGLDPGHRPRLVTTVHGLYSVNAYSAVMTRGERVIAVSAAVRDYVLENYPAMDPGRLVVIHRGVDTGKFTPGFRPPPGWLEHWYRQYPFLQNRYVLTLPGRIGRRKGVRDFIELIAALRNRGLPVHGLVVGVFPDGGCEPGRELRSLMTARGVNDVLTFTGYRDDVREIMAVSAAVLSLSRYPEAFGRTVNEALGLGIPVAGYAHGGVGEQLAANFPAGRIPPGDITALVERLAAWYAEPPSMRDVSPWTLDDMLEQTLALYRELALHG